jgi:hypothetical protein
LAGEFPIERWTKRREAEGWRGSQVPAGPGDADGGSGRGGGEAPGAPVGDEPRSYREAALARFGEPPVDAEAWEVRAYWTRRQSALPVDFHGDLLKPHEVEFVERFLDAGEQLEWIPNDPAVPTSDLRWNGVDYELKSTLAKYSTIRGRILSASSKAMRNHGVVKENFIIDLGAQPIPPELLNELANYNVGRRHYRIVRLWVMSGGVLSEVVLT